MNLFYPFAVFVILPGINMIYHNYKSVVKGKCDA